jgi:hypothetical protein
MEKFGKRTKIIAFLNFKYIHLNQLNMRGNKVKLRNECISFCEIFVQLKLIFNCNLYLKI